MGTWDFTYDTLNRLVTADSAADAPAPYTNNYGCWTYDAIGNRTAESMSGTNCSSNPPLASFASYAPGSNQFASTSQSLGGVPYDASGNVLADDSHWYLYDGEGRLCAVASVPMPGITAMTGYLYDAAGRRVAKGTIASWSCDPAVNGFQSTNDYILGQSGEQITEMGMNAAGMAWQHTNVYAAGTLLATYDAGDLHFYLNDPLGTRRAQTDHAGVPEQTCSGLPFGNGTVCSGGNLEAPTEHHFTGKERDTESGNDYFGARYYSNAMGRMISPDPSGIASVDPSNPQSWNMYSYALNNPLAFVDPTGLDSCPQAAVALGNMGDDSSDDGGCDPPQELPNIDPCEGQGSSCEQKDAAKNIAESADALSMVDWMLQGCRAALQVTNKDQAGLFSAFSSWPTLQQAGSSNGVAPSLLAAVGIRESNFAGGNEKDGAGVGVGVFQLTVSPTSGVTATQANDLPWASNRAASMLATNHSLLAPKYSGPGTLLQATAAGFNMSPYNPANYTGDPNTIDKGTAKGNYGSNVVGIMKNCF